MKAILVFFILGQTFFSYAQQDSMIFDNKFEFNDGIYTSYLEALYNEPRYADCLLEIDIEPLFGLTSLFYIDKTMNKHEYMDSLFSFVKNGKMEIWYKKRLNKLTIKGAISVFYLTKYYRYSTGYTSSDDDVFFLDLITGEIEKLNYINIGEIFKRDKLLYEEFSGTPVSKKKKNLYSYILKYNLRNLVYIKIK